MSEPISNDLNRPSVIASRAFRLGMIATVLILGVSIATLAADETEGAETKSSKPPITSTDPPKVDPSKPTHATPANLAEKATDPTAILMQMQFQYHGLHTEGSDADGTKWIVQPILPASKTNVVRATLPILSTPEPGGRIDGIGDLVVLDFFMFHTKKASLAFGPAVSIPTATDDALGSGKLAIGPNFLWIYKGIKKTQWGILAEYLVSVAGDGDRDDVNELLWQPIFTHHFKWGYVSWSDQQWAIDFEHDRHSIPIGMSLGKVFMAKKVPWNISVEPYYTFNSDNRPNGWAIKFGWTAIFPRFKW
jgi:hypothetical protein